MMVVPSVSNVKTFCLVAISILLAGYLPDRAGAMYVGPDCNEIHLPWYPLLPYFGKTLTFVTNIGSSDANNFTLYTVGIKDGALHKIGKIPYPSAVAISSDGTKIAFVNQTGKTPQLFSANTDGSGMVQITHDNESKSVIGITPDGKRVIYSIHYDSIARVTNYFSIGSDGNNKIQITNDTMRKGWTQISYDGSTIAFNDESRQPRIYSVKTDGTGLHYVTNGSLFSHTPLISGDGSKIAFSRDNPGDSNSKFIYTINTDGTNPVKLLPKPIYFQSDFTISLDGKKVAFDDNTGDAYYVSVVDSDGTNYRQLGNPIHDYSHTPLLSSNGSIVAYSSGIHNRLFMSDLTRGNESSQEVTSSIIGFEKEINPITGEAAFPEILQGGMGLYAAAPDGRWFSLIDNSVFRPDPNCRVTLGGTADMDIHVSSAKSPQSSPDKSSELCCPSPISTEPIHTDPVLPAQWYSRVNGWVWTGIATAGVIGFWAFYFKRSKER